MILDVKKVRKVFSKGKSRVVANDNFSFSYILITHNVIEAEKAVDRMAILHKGRFLATGTPEEVKSSVSNLIRIELNLLNEKQEIEMPEWVVRSRRKGGRLFFSVKQSSVLSVIEWAGKQVEMGKIINYSMSQTTIEDVYFELTTGKEMSA